MSTGNVKFFNESKGFGFISQDKGEDIFFHVSELQSPSKSANEGDKVEYEVGEGRKGPCAMNIREVSSY
jgi:cold shock protein